VATKVARGSKPRLASNRLEAARGEAAKNIEEYHCMRTILALAAFGLASGASIAFAQDEGVMDAPTVVEVPVGDVDLSQPEDQDELMARIRFSAQNACGGTPDSMLDLKSWDYYRACRNGAVDDALNQLQNR
jgi:UrcA family protein